MEISKNLEKERCLFYVLIDKAKHWFNQETSFLKMCKDLGHRSGLTSV